MCSKHVHILFGVCSGSGVLSSATFKNLTMLMDFCCATSKTSAWVPPHLVAVIGSFLLQTQLQHAGPGS